MIVGTQIHRHADVRCLSRKRKTPGMGRIQRSKYRIRGNARQTRSGRIFGREVGRQEMPGKKAEAEAGVSLRQLGVGQ